MSRRTDVMKNFYKYREYMNDRASKGIEQNRKDFVTVTVLDKDKNPISNAKITANQKTHSFKYGANIFMLDQLETQEKNNAYKSYFKDAFNMATLPFYWNDLEPERGKPRYDKNSPFVYRRPSTDLCMDFCKTNGIEPREHALAYEHFFPKWLKGKSVREVKYAFEKRCSEIAERYAEDINTIEVTNEMFWDNGVTKFYREPDYVEWCFKTAEKYFPNNQLVINEWSGLWDNWCQTSSQYYLIIENALLKGARIDAVGMQYHMFYKKDEEAEKTVKTYDPVKLYDVLDTYSVLKKPIQITEVTVPAYSNDAEDEEIQAEIIKNLYTIWFSYPNVEQIIYWNLVDGYAAFAKQGDMTAGENYYYGGLLRFDLSPKPAYYAVKDLFEKEWRTNASLTTDENGTAGFRGFYGKYDLTVNAGGREIVKEIEITKDKLKNNSIEIEL